MDILNFKKGEAKYIRTVAKPLDDRDIVVIVNATYEISDASGEIHAEGNWDIDSDNIMSILYHAEKAGIYRLKITVVVGAETHIGYAKIVVRE